MKTLLLSILLLTPLAAPAAVWQQLTDQQKVSRLWQSVADFESGNNDFVPPGAHDERGALQILPREWRAMTSWPISLATNRACSLAVGQKLMDGRVRRFMATFHRVPSLFEWYVLYNAPAQIRHPNPAVAERAGRFVNLCSRPS